MLAPMQIYSLVCLAYFSKWNISISQNGILIFLGILVVYDFALVFALAPISLMFCPKFLPLPLPSILPI